MTHVSDPGLQVSPHDLVSQIQDCRSVLMIRVSDPGLQVSPHDLVSQIQDAGQAT